MKRLNGFSLMEMMIVLAIVAIVAAASAPMVNKKMVRAASEKSPWVWTGGDSIAYNLDNPRGIQDNKTARIGSGTNKPDGIHPRLYITTNDNTTPHIMFGHYNHHAPINKESGWMKLIAGGENNSITFTSNEETGGINSVVIGSGASASGNNFATALGFNAHSHAAFSTAVGAGANAQGAGSIAIGAAVGNNNNNAPSATGTSAIAIGGVAKALKNFSIAIGNNAHIVQNTNGEGSIMIGNGAHTTQDSTTSIGINAASTGQRAIALGMNASSSGADAISIGSSASSQDNDRTRASGNSSIAIGSGAQAIFDNAIAIGDVGPTPVNANGGENSIAIGNDIRVNQDNTITIGTGSLSTGARAITLGMNTSAGANAIAIGSSNSNNETLITRAAANSIAIGYQTRVTAENSVAIGRGASATATNSIAIGRGAGSSNNAASNCIYLGTFTGINARGSNNIFIGRAAGSNVTGSNKICIGANSGPKVGMEWASDSYERIFIGGQSKFNGGPAVLEIHNTGIKGAFGRGDVEDSTVVINGNLIVKGTIAATMHERDGNDYKNDSYVNIIGRTSGQLEPIGWGNIKTKWHNDDMGKFKSLKGKTDFSDRRLKNVGKEFTSGLDKIKKLEVFNYTFKDDKSKTPRVGVMAQDLQKIFPDAVVKGEDGFLRIRMEDMFYAVVNAVKELDSRISLLEQKQKRIDELEKRVDKLEKRLADLEKRVK